MNEIAVAIVTFVGTILTRFSLEIFGAATAMVGIGLIAGYLGRARRARK